MTLADGYPLRDQTPEDEGVDVTEQEVRIRQARRRGGSLTRKIVIFNLIALNVLFAGILYLSASRDSLAQQRVDSLRGDVELIADVFEARLNVAGDRSAVAIDPTFVEATLEGLDVQIGNEVFVFDAQTDLVGRAEGTIVLESPVLAENSATVITDALNRFWDTLSAPFSASTEAEEDLSLEDQTRVLFGDAMKGETKSNRWESEGITVFTVATPIVQDGVPAGVVALANASGEIDKLTRIERERVLQMFLVATFVSVGLSLILASTIAKPLAELAVAAEGGGNGHPRKTDKTGRVRIPDLTARPDEIGRLSGALRGMVAALYHRIEGNEQFAADVAHEIKNPLASLRSAVGTLRVAKRDDQREKLLDVIEHDVRRLDRLVSDISNASRLDSELVREDQQPFDLIGMLQKLSDYLGEEARQKGIEFISDFPQDPIVLTGLEGRLAQVFVNLITNAISFCDAGDAIRIWARRRDNRVVVVVEDTGPGIPEQALTKIFQRFYSQRDASDFGNNSGLGLSISKQIVEAHGGAIWAENIRPAEEDITSDSLGARFIVGLPI